MAQFSATSRILSQLAAIAASPWQTPILPSGWDLQATLASDTSQQPPVPPAQGFYAQGLVDGTTIGVLAVGSTWKQVFENMSTTGPILGPLPSGVATSAPTAKCEQILGAMYAQLRRAIWARLSSVGTNPFYVAGTGPGAALAQLAAADLLPGNKGPGGESGPMNPSTCYAFSCPPFANAAFASYVGQNAKAAYTVAPGTPTVAADLFPSAPTSALGYAPVGSPVIATSALPTPDDPWVERGPNFYLSALGGTPDVPPVTPGVIVSPPAGFDQTLAFALAQLSALAYARLQHENLPFQLAVAPYVFQADVLSGGVPLCAIFASGSAVVAAFRGTVTWQEVLAVQGNTIPVQAPFLPANASISQGALTIYTANTTSSSGTPFRQALATLLQQLSTGKRVYLTGHDFGGVLASIAAYRPGEQHEADAGGALHLRQSAAGKLQLRAALQPGGWRLELPGGASGRLRAEAEPAPQLRANQPGGAADGNASRRRRRPAFDQRIHLPPEPGGPALTFREVFTWRRARPIQSPRPACSRLARVRPPAPRARSRSPGCRRPWLRSAS